MLRDLAVRRRHRPDAGRDIPTIRTGRCHDITATARRGPRRVLDAAPARTWEHPLCAYSRLGAYRTRSHNVYRRARLTPADRRLCARRRCRRRRTDRPLRAAPARQIASTEPRHADRQICRVCRSFVSAVRGRYCRWFGWFLLGRMATSRTRRRRTAIATPTAPITAPTVMVAQPL